ncbi:MAG TPA: aryl-sulfate sulfotransferase, partial [Ilumatobacteraceae bacterium]
ELGRAPDRTATAATGLTCAAPGGAPAPPLSSGGFVGQVPDRLADTRQGEPVPAGCWLRVDLPASVPAGATAVALTITADRAAEPGFLTAHPCGSSLPLLSNVNVNTRGPTSNLALVGLDATRAVCIFSSGRTDVIIDIVGHVAPGGAPMREIEPARVLDTRNPNLRPPDLTGQAPVTRVLEVSRDQLGVPTDATAVIVNLTATEASGYGYLTAFPCNGTRPGTSNVNYDRGVDRANTAIMALGPQGSLCVQSAVSTTHVLIDVIGWFGGAGDDVRALAFQSAPVRVADSRVGLGGWTTPFSAGETRVLHPTEAGRLPDGTRVAVFGVIATRAVQSGFLQFRPCGSDADVSSLNFVAGVDLTNVVTVPLADDGTVCVRASVATDVVVDAYGGFRADGAVRSFSFGPLELQPPFAHDRTDYVAYCTAPTGNHALLDVRGMPGTTVSVAGQTATPHVQASLTVAADDAIVITVTPPGGTPTEYWIRCLPPRFPHIATSGSGANAPGWYLLANGAETTTDNYLMILNGDGVPVWYREGAPSRTPRNLQLMDNGDLTWFESAGFAFGIDPANGYDRRELDGTLVTTYKVAPPNATNHHDLVELSNGNVLLTSMPLVDAEPDQTCHPQPGTGTTTATKVAGARIEEVSADGSTTVWSWEMPADLWLAGMLVDICFTPAPNEWYLSSVHPNGITVSADESTVYLSARHHDAIYAIDRATGDIEWKLGGIPVHGVPSLTIVGDPRDGPKRPHDPRILPNGHLTMFDNRSSLPFAPTTGAARYLEYAIDESAMTATFVRQVSDPQGRPSGALGSARLQPDGSLVVNWGSIGLGPVFTEFDAAGAILFQVSMPGINSSYRTVKEPPEAFDLAELRATAGQ